MGELPALCSWCARHHEGGPERCLSGVLLVCGGRDYADRARVWRVLDHVALRMEVRAVRHGAARGADMVRRARRDGLPLWEVARG